MKFSDKFLPTQWENKRLNLSSKLDDLQSIMLSNELLCRFTDSFNGFSDYNDLKLKAPEHMPVERMASNPITIALVQFLIYIHRPKILVELGTFIGISAIKMAEAMPRGGAILTVEKGFEFLTFANENIINNPLDHASIMIFYDDALSYMKNAAENKATADFIFLDADKEHYDEYLEPISSVLVPGGILVVDDVFFHGDVLNNEPKTDKGLGCQRLLEKAKEMSWPKVVLPLANGILIMQKPR